MGCPVLCTGANLMCSLGAAPSSLAVLPVNRVMVNGKPAANMMDNKPMVNILPFGMCLSLANPQVIAATVAALGVLTPMPCIPMTTAPWIPASPQTLIAKMPIINVSATLMCQWGGVIKAAPAQVTVLA